MDVTEGINWIGLTTITGLILVLAGVLYVNVLKPDKKDAAAFADLAKRRGWRVQRQLAALGKGYRVDVTPASGSGWSCRVTRYFNSPTKVLSTEFRLPSARIVDGMVVIGPALPDADAAMAENLLGGTQGLIERMLSFDLKNGASAAHLSGLRRVTKPSLTGANVFATEMTDAKALADGFASHLRRWQAKYRGEKTFPILIVSPDGFTLRLRVDADAPQLEAFIDMACAVAQDISK
jgi:hypothetical protein